MLLCRRTLFQLEFVSFRLCRFASQQATTLPPTSKPNVPNRLSSLRSELSSSSAFHLLQRLSDRKNADTDTDEGTDKMSDKLTDLQAYSKLRGIDRSSLAALPLPSYFKLLKQASTEELPDLVAQLTEDMLESCPQSKLASAALAIISSSILPLVPPRFILPLVRHLHDSTTHLDRLIMPDVAVLVRTVADAPPDEVDKSLVDLVYPLLLTRLRNLPLPAGNDVLTYTPPTIINASFAFVDQLLKLSQERRALEIFQILVNSGNIPSEAVQTIPGLKDFASIVRFSLVRASTHWRWRPLAERFLSPMLRAFKTSPSPDHPIMSLTLEILYACLDTPSIPDLRACRLLLCHMHSIAPVPNGIVRSFYNVAEQIDAGAEAHALYAFTRSEEVLETHRYPCPRGASLPWLLNYLLKIHSYLAKELGNEVLEGNHPIPVESRPRIVAGLALAAHALLARGLWSRFAVGKDRDQFVGNPFLMLRMVTTFHYLMKTQDDILEARSGMGEFLDDDLVRERSEEYRGFLNFVLSEFERTHSPIAEAHHRVLTTLARAYFVVGEFVRGFDAIKLLLLRQELPDIYDVNVTLTVMAEHDPRVAAGMVERMIEKGLKPDSITFGTIMHHALRCGDMELVDEMVNRVRELPDSQLSYKSIVSLVRGTVDFGVEFASRSRLQAVFNIIKSVGRTTVVAAPQLGRYLVFAALRAEDPVMAYTFWDYILRETADWHDQEQIFQRRLMVDRLALHQKKNWIGEDQARAMIKRLQTEPSLDD
ncbi:hypothetical protein C8R43DRAFT_536430 [Mycena crocata]|nr:hypothetical protein C8R43DRAFT_536430 [Mycena crocata]